MKQVILLLFFVVCVASLKAQSSNKPDLTVYPNPTTEYISVNDSHDAVGFIAVYNLVGKKMRDFEFTRGEQYYIADLPKGIYLVQIQDRSHKAINTQKVDKR
ncbi:MAG: T9SS type A sorting domain-containing protein [Lewinellaceae bacterium]|nr:T9SS type A sorting domain-containing protein [Lewinellaceae bacterium]